MSRPTNARLYARVKAEAKRKFERWPSAYGSAWLAREYTRRGGKYDASPRGNGGVARWMQEEWVQVVPYLERGQRVACGSPTTRQGKACRPMHRMSSKTPPTLPELVRAHGKAKVHSLARRKSRHMDGRVSWRQGTFRNGRKGRKGANEDARKGRHAHDLDAPKR